MAIHWPLLESYTLNIKKKNALAPHSLSFFSFRHHEWLKSNIVFAEQLQKTIEY